MKKLAIMQPYFFPYIGYFQLIAAVDRFVVYDDVAFIKQGWINRNRLLLGGETRHFTVPLKDASSFRQIRETEIDDRQPWRAKLLRTIEQGYAKAPYVSDVLPLISGVIQSSERTIGKLALKSIQAVCSYLEVPTEVVETSSFYGNAELSGQDRILDICKAEACTHYVNAAGGAGLYDREAFQLQGIELQFVRPESITYPQRGAANHVPWLSIIDVLMANSRERVRDFLNQCAVR